MYRLDNMTGSGQLKKDLKYLKPWRIKIMGSSVLCQEQDK